MVKFTLSFLFLLRVISLNASIDELTIITTLSGKKIYCFSDDHVFNLEELKVQIPALLNVLREVDKQDDKCIVYVEEQGPDFFPRYPCWYFLYHFPLAFKKQNFEHLEYKSCEVRKLCTAISCLLFLTPRRMELLTKYSDSISSYLRPFYDCLLHTVTLNDYFARFEQLKQKSIGYRDTWADPTIKELFNYRIRRAEYWLHELQTEIEQLSLDINVPFINLVPHIQALYNRQQMIALDEKIIDALCPFLDLFLLNEILNIEFYQPEIKKVAIFAGNAHLSSIAHDLWDLGHQHQSGIDFEFYMPAYDEYSRGFTYTHFKAEWFPTKAEKPRELLSEDGFRLLLDLSHTPQQKGWLLNTGCSLF